MFRTENGAPYYSYALLYVDDILSICHYSEDVLKRLYKYFNLNPGSLGDPDIYGKFKIQKIKLHYGVWSWSSIPVHYAHDSVKNMEKYLVENLGRRWKFPDRADNPFTVGYLPELDEYTVL